MRHYVKVHRLLMQLSTHLKYMKNNISIIDNISWDKPGQYSPIEYIGEYFGSHIYMKRDDKLPFSYGGNKVRIAHELMTDIRAGGYTAVISYGSASSNMNRAIADMANAYGIKCYVIIKTEHGAEAKAETENVSEAKAVKETENVSEAEHKLEARVRTSVEKETENERLVKRTGAELIYCSDNNVRACVEAVLARAAEEGYKPYYIYGDSTGSGNELSLMRASCREYAEIKAYELENSIDFDAIVLTAGTGMTIAGLAAAVNDELKATGTHTPKLIGISAARTTANSLAHIRNDLLTYYKGDESRIKQLPQIIDNYLCGGYGQYNDDIESVILDMESKGTALDPCYTGKSYCGMLSEIRKGHLKGDILFIHTGGYPVYLDWKKK